jgi:branched-chain amino acid aminotransferase
MEVRLIDTQSTSYWHDHDRAVLELVTPPLDGMILPGVTRDSVLVLAREHIKGIKRLAGLPENLVVSERPVTMQEVKNAAETGRLVELFGTGDTPSPRMTRWVYRWMFVTGTAAVISPVDKIGYLGGDILIPTGEDGMGPISRPLWKELSGRQTGEIPSEWSVVVAE